MQGCGGRREKQKRRGGQEGAANNEVAGRLMMPRTLPSIAQHHLVWVHEPGELQASFKHHTCKHTQHPQAEASHLGRQVTASSTSPSARTAGAGGKGGTQSTQKQWDLHAVHQLA